MAGAMIDLRSDTVTRPSPGMRKAIAAAEVGDDVMGDDPTVNRLEMLTAEMFGKEAALFLPSGTMGNIIAVKLFTRPGDSIVCEAQCHLYYYEVGGPAFISQVLPVTVKGEGGFLLTPELIEKNLLHGDIHRPTTTVVSIENTHNRAGGRVFPISVQEKVYELVKKRELKLHVDGARIWNAHVKTGVSLSEYGRLCDSMQVCFSKGLGAPVGSILLGERDFIQSARKVRKSLGGGMRQVGLLAQGCIYGIENNLPRLAEDHEKALMLAEGVKLADWSEVDLESVETNIVLVRIRQEYLDRGWNGENVAKALERSGAQVIAFGSDVVRAVCHLDLSADEIKRAVDLFMRISPKI